MNWLTLLAPQSLLTRIGTIALLSAAIFCFGWVKGAGHVEMEWSKQTAELGRAHDAEVSRLALAQAKVEIRYVERIKTVKHAAEVITKEVPLYVTKTDDARCTIPDGFVSLLNRAAQSGVPRTDTPGAVDDPAAVARTAPR